jgi:hypothetical protein
MVSNITYYILLIIKERSKQCVPEVVAELKNFSRQGLSQETSKCKVKGHSACALNTLYTAVCDIDMEFHIY